MVRTKQSNQTAKRNGRHSAAWGKRLSMVLFLATSMAFGQQRNADS